MLNKKGLTLVELLAVVAIIGILSGIAIMAVSKYQAKTTNEVYSNFEKQLKDSTINYLTSNLSEIPTNETTIYAKKLLEKSYLDALVDPVVKTKQCTNEDEEKDSYVKVKNKGNITSINDDYAPNVDENGNMIINSSKVKNLDLEYTVCLKCSQYKSKGCS